MKTRPQKGSGSPEVGAPQASVGPASSQATASTIAHKYRRALKNGTGATLTFLELQLLARLGALDLVTPCRKCGAHELARDTSRFVVWGP
jgi:hypothetical protein